MPKPTKKTKARAKIVAVFLMLIGAIIIVQPVLSTASQDHPLALYNQVTIDNCDTPGTQVWSSSGGSVDVDTDCVEGSGSMRWDTGTMWSGWVSVGLYESSALISRHALAFNMKVSRTENIGPVRLEMYFGSTANGEVVIATYEDFELSLPDDWQEFEIDLESPISIGSWSSDNPYTVDDIEWDNIYIFRFWWNRQSASPLSDDWMKIDPLIVGSLTAPTPTPISTPTPTPSPTPSPPTPTPAPDEFQVSISPTDPSGTINILVGESQIFTATVLNGAPSYTYNWYMNSFVESIVTDVSTTSTFDTGALSIGTYDVHVEVTDLNSDVANSNTVRVLVTETPLPTPTPQQPIDQSFIVLVLQEIAGAAVFLSGILVLRKYY